ncbi:PREDICTED: uncharacterized protein LOC107881184 [Prunus mume]|uniref:Uncharacterized protein LOC107881184 n=1 Tax=Prunus mume TaxID=102107 RepID=A0ABM1LR36_PRUMU|nr:PREDICTED: uncharacterized protein LOC107881184 [Prunus mume]
MSGGYYSSSNSQHDHHHHPTFPLHLCFFLLVLLTFVGFSWYINYESLLEGIFDQVKLVLMVSPLLLLLVVHWLSNNDRRRVPSLIPLPEKDSLHRAGGTPWGVGFLLVFLFFMISYQSYFQERWFPLLSR